MVWALFFWPQVKPALASPLWWTLCSIPILKTLSLPTLSLRWSCGLKPTTCMRATSDFASLWSTQWALATKWTNKRGKRNLSFVWRGVVPLYLSHKPNFLQNLSPVWEILWFLTLIEISSLIVHRPCLSVLQLPAGGGLHRQAVWKLPARGAENQALPSQLPRLAAPCLPLFHFSLRPLSQVTGLGNHEEAWQQGNA